MGAYSKVNATSTSAIPFRDFLAVLQFRIENINRTAEDMESTKVVMV